MADIVEAKTTRRQVARATKRRGLQQQQVLGRCRGCARKREVFRNEIFVHARHEVVGCYFQSGYDGKEDVTKHTKLLLEFIHAWIDSVVACYMENKTWG